MELPIASAQLRALAGTLEAYIPELAAKGIHNMISITVGFVCDHVEIMYDIDIEAQAAAREHAVRLVRPPALNTDPLFIQELTDVIREHAAKWMEA